MTDEELRKIAGQRAYIDERTAALFAPEDDALRAARTAAQEAGLPSISISPVEGQFLAVLASACQARKILEIGALGGYSGIWLARALPVGGKLISLDINPHHADVARAALSRAGLADRAEVRVGPAGDLLPKLQDEAPFDLVFIDADKPGYPLYLEWALRLTRPGSIIVADNVVWRGEALRPDPDPSDESAVALVQYNRQVAAHPRLRSVALPIDEGGTDGFAVSVVLA